MIRYVIALEGSARLEQFNSQKDAKKFKVWRAFNGYVEDTPDFVDPRGFEKILGRAPSPGEIGCSVSHYLLCMHFIENYPSEELMLVAEDDARFSTHAEKIIRRVIKFTDWNKVGIVVLSSPGLEAGERRFFSIPQKLAVMSILSKPVGWAGRYPYILGSFSGMALGTGCYLISKTAAQKYVKLVESGQKIYWAADFYNIWAKKSAIKVHLLRPGICSWEGESTIGGLDHSWTVNSSAANEKLPFAFKGIKGKLFVRERLKRLKRSFRSF